MALNYSYDKIIKYMIKAECVEPLHIGSAAGSTEEVLIHPVDHALIVKVVVSKNLYFFVHAGYQILFCT